ncbi:hypothetical protein DS742_06025 [Lacrimispora amygdalina]|uniref:DUF340 domain-containing protein n=1 Tax=Lacrimispora amygdalina TaxID=253257 RepID=A0A3E2NG94_9FIRM|nr:hypothetical protein [Clostridium indicum]RFZ80014.1 hypothetical protein DS742_06025 [Clostridium indicum]
MVRKYFVQQLGLLLMVSVIIILTNIIGYKMPVKDSIIGVLLLSAISLIGLTISKFMSRFVKLPSMMYVSLLGLLLACPVSPVKDIVVVTTTPVAFLAPATALGAFAGISLGKDLKDFTKMGWKLVLITLFVITGTFIFSALVADIVLKMTGAI